MAQNRDQRLCETWMKDVYAQALASPLFMYWPLFAVFLSGLGFSLQTLVIKKLEENGFGASFQVIFSRGFVQCGLASYAIHIGYSTPEGGVKGPLFGPDNFVRGMLFCRSVIGYGGIAFAFLAVERLPLADAICLVMLSPLVSSTVAYFFLGEPFRKQEQIAIGTSSLGMVFVVKPSFIFGSDVSLDPVGVTYGLIAACSAGCAYVFVRILGTRAKMPWENVCFAQSLGQLTLALPFLYMFKQHFKLFPSVWEFFMIATAASIGALSQILMTVGMQREKSAAAGAMRMSDLLFGFIWQQLLTKDKVTALSIIGAFLIVTGVLIIVFTKEKSQDGTSSSGASRDEGARAKIVAMIASKPIYNPIAMEDEESSPATESTVAAVDAAGESSTMVVSQYGARSDGEVSSARDVKGGRWSQGSQSLYDAVEAEPLNDEDYASDMDEDDFAALSAMQESLEGHDIEAGVEEERMVRSKGEDIEEGGAAGL